VREFRLSKVDRPTLFVTIFIYTGWLALTAFHASIPNILLFILGGALLAWHGSLQHETIHGHPTGVAVFDGAIGFVPLAMWLPYPIYRRSHLAHHRCGAITDPISDPESHYHDGRSAIVRVLARLHSNLVGRLIIGPPISIVRFLMAETRRFAHEPWRAARDWLPHLLAVAVLLLWLRHFHLDVLRYVLFFIYPGTMLTMLRSFAEHNATLPTPARAASVDRGGVLALIYLNNNLHAAHHERPALSWFELPAYHRQHRQRFAREGATLYASYGEIFRRFTFAAHDDMVHPTHRVVSPEPG
jgi:fatty acid desaturase